MSGKGKFGSYCQAINVDRRPLVPVRVPESTPCGLTKSFFIVNEQELRWYHLNLPSPGLFIFSTTKLGV